MENNITNAGVNKDEIINSFEEVIEKNKYFWGETKDNPVRLCTVVTKETDSGNVVEALATIGERNIFIYQIDGMMHFDFKDTIKPCDIYSSGSSYLYLNAEFIDEYLNEIENAVNLSPNYTYIFGDFVDMRGFLWSLETYDDFESLSLGDDRLSNTHSNLNEKIGEWFEVPSFDDYAPY
ncbi:MULTISPECIES: hypothetical protein [unclassified Breznakia]|uniref:hypothetical protein n=1 Tax=unclassified Breznakia TaxID=2623764 RepID=UPI002473ADEA|nr:MULTISPECIES: hypothetical protein [unclassified Breznakia]MDH6367377.1 hypothetical protein [Breznakia sp. PH1-1]MDH6403909.1 hypothetical protein [Breznakia sp. PF1-11]MDH6411618.1 hypothetical protein [Breznakia sp. PFB1-11]MDH6414544.1 hypothetical protein [Breznakia sp. PFB1-14]MDH6418650.1 hypothetical protein [Breznakia sp. PFB1-12]